QGPAPALTTVSCTSIAYEPGRMVKVRRICTPSGPFHTNGTVTCSPSPVTRYSRSPPSATKPDSCVGAAWAWLTQPLWAAYQRAGSVSNSLTGGLSSSRVCGYCSSAASTTLPFSRVRRRTSVVTVTRSPGAAADAWAAVAVSPAGGATGMLGAAGTDAPPASGAWAVGTAPPCWSSAGTGGSGAASTLASLRHSIQSSIATISQAKIRRVRVWFIGQAGSQAGGIRRGGTGGGWGAGHCAVRGRDGQRAGALQQRAQALAQRGTGGRGRLGAGHDHVGARAQPGPEQAELFAQLALDAVAAHRVAVDLARDRQPQPRRGTIVVPVQGHQR